LKTLTKEQFEAIQPYFTEYSELLTSSFEGIQGTIDWVQKLTPEDYANETADKKKSSYESYESSAASSTGVDKKGFQKIQQNVIDKNDIKTLEKYDTLIVDITKDTIK
jgi:hypothetical protein